MKLLLLKSYYFLYVMLFDTLIFVAPEMIYTTREGRGSKDCWFIRWHSLWTAPNLPFTMLPFELITIGHMALSVCDTFLTHWFLICKQFRHLGFYGRAHTELVFWKREKQRNRNVDILYNTTSMKLFFKNKIFDQCA